MCWLQGGAADLCTLLEKVMSEVSDKTSIRYLNKFRDALKKFTPGMLSPSLALD